MITDVLLLLWCNGFEENSCAATMLAETTCNYIWHLSSNSHEKKDF